MPSVSGWLFQPLTNTARETGEWLFYALAFGLALAGGSSTRRTPAPGSRFYPLGIGQALAAATTQATGEQ